jgi:Domain of unknown function (DUF5658)
MLLSLARRFDITATYLDLKFKVWSYRHVSWPLYRWRWWIVAYLVTFSILDLVLTQNILSLVASRTGQQPAEANPIMAPIVMSWWAWPVRVGIPLLIALADIRPSKVTTNISHAAFGAILYGAVVAWNTHMYQIVSMT